ncbi:hypothetical protein PINS_up005144 [Pythium insidiosum]|nr:hypothetical protein PINS_up005144 [Pythium insidiosum]
MTPEHAFDMLIRLAQDFATAPTVLMDGLTSSQVLEAINDACWRWHPYRGKPLPTSPRSPRSEGPLTVRYSQLCHGLDESILDGEKAVQALEVQVFKAIEHTNVLPTQIHDLEQTIDRTISSFVALSAASLDCAIPSVQRGLSLEKSRARARPERQIDEARLAARVKDKIATLRRRKELRMWACEELRDVINDHETKISELKKEITVILGDVKREELANKVKTKRLEDAIASIAPTFSSRKNSLPGLVASKFLSAGTVAMLAANGSAHPGSTPSAASARLADAQERQAELRDEILQRKEIVRQRTEEIFDVRNRMRDVERHVAELIAEREALETEMVEIQRTCTPRPDWNELRSAVMVTTAADRAAKNGRFKPLGRDRRSSAAHKGADADDEDDVETRLNALLLNKWSTVDKVKALSQELARIRSRYHGGDELSAEQAKLDQLQKEIQKTLQQLAVVRAMSTGSA